MMGIPVRLFSRLKRSLRKISLMVYWTMAVNTLVCLSTEIRSQSPTFTPIAPQFLSTSSVNCFHKDNAGFLWIGTADGLFRYDGTNVVRYVHKARERATLTHNAVKVIAEGPDKRIWIGTAQGLCVYDRENDNFISVDSIKGSQNFLSNRYITGLDFDDRGHLWIGTHGGGINVYDPENLKFIYLNDDASQGVLPSTSFVTAVLAVDNVIWCATKGGLILFDASSKRKMPSAIESSAFNFNQIGDMAMDNAGNVWIGILTGEIIKATPKNGYYSFQKVYGVNYRDESSRHNLTLCFDSRGKLLAGGENAGMNIIDAKTNTVTSLTAKEGAVGQLPVNSVRRIYTDSSGKVWIGTIGSGVFRLDSEPKTFREWPAITKARAELGSKEARAFAEDREGNIWVAYHGLGLAVLNPITRSVVTYQDINQKLQNKNVTSVICDRQGFLWLGAAGTGVLKIDPQRHSVEKYAVVSDGFGNDRVSCLYEDRAGIIWAGTAGSGLFYFDSVKKMFRSATERTKGNHIPYTAYVSCMIEDSEGTFWVGTLYGLYALTHKSQTTFTYRVFFPSDSIGHMAGGQVHAIIEDRKKNLWIATGDNGLSLKAAGKKSFRNFGIEDGLVSSTTRSIQIDRDENLWIGGNMGLSKMDIESETFNNYSTEDGLLSNNFCTNASLRSSSGEFYFGTIKGFNAFYPDSINAVQNRLSLYLSDLKINNQSVKPKVAGSPLDKHISLTSKLDLTYEQRSFSIDFAAIDFSQSAPLFCYKLEGFDKSWNCSVTARNATYTNLDPGHYVFLVKAGHRENISDETPLRLEITIQQVIWKRWWAISLYFIFAFVVIYVFVKIRIERLKMKNQIAMERVAREREHELGESKTEFFTNISHEFRTPLSLVLMPLESLVHTDEVPVPLRERISTAYKNAERMMRLVNELMDFTKAESGNHQLNIQHGELLRLITETASAFTEVADRRNIKFLVTANVERLQGWYDRDKLERILFNVLSNAFKFTANGGEIRLDVSTKHAAIEGTLYNCVELRIVDNGIGISADEIPRIFDKFYQAKSSTRISTPGTGIGLSLTKALVEMHRGSITVESIPERETIFTILLPIDAKAYHLNEVSQTPVDVFDSQTPVQLMATTNNVEEDGGSAKAEVLIVEDNAELREYLVRELKNEYSVIEAMDGDEGYAIAMERVPDLIISDIMMPGKSGIELCHVIKTEVSTSHIPFILLTAKATVDDQITGVSTGADLYVTKPFNIRYLMAQIHQIIESRKVLYSKFSQDVYLMPGKVANNEIDQAFLQKAIDHIVNNLQDSQLGVHSLADLFNASRVQIYRKIKALTGKSVVEFIRMVRIKQAIKLMDTHKFTLSEIAYQTGFSSSSYFTRCFKDEYGKTPSEYLQKA